MLTFLLINVALFIGSYFAGCIPISFNLPARRLRILTVFGVGLLLGAALVIIIPEGVNSLYSSQHEKMDTKDASGHVHLEPGTALSKDKQHGLLGDSSLLDNAHPENPSTLSKVSTLPIPSLGLHQHIGFALLSGYLFMLAVDQLGESLFQSRWGIGLQSCLYMFGHCCCRRCKRGFPISSNSSNSTSTGSGGGGGTGVSGIATPGGATDVSNASSSGQSPAPGRRQRVTATIGLVFHSFADGLALGAAFAVGQMQLEVILFFAIFLHKVPAAFGLCCYLIHEGFSRDQIRLHLAIFAAAAPLASLVTYGFLAWPSVELVPSSSVAKTGFTLLLSGGTFLYVAASHILPELIQSQHGQHHSDNDAEMTSSGSTSYTMYAVSSQDASLVYSNPNTLENGMTGKSPMNATQHLSVLEFFVLTCGSLIPFFLSTGHSH